MSGVHRLVVWIVGVVLVLSVAFIGLLSLQGMPIPDALQNISVGGLTGLLGLLVTSPARGSSPPP